jgi:uncharacterized protein YjbI with pentapeptide repeats
MSDIIDFSLNDLSNIDFSGQDLSNKIFSQKNLSFSIFTNTIVSGANFQNCILNQARLGPLKDSPIFDSGDYRLFGISIVLGEPTFWILGKQLNLIEVDMTNWNLSNLNLDLSGSNLSRANLTNANLSGVILTNANLSGANLTNANLSGANLTNANLSGANLEGVIVSNATINRTNIYKATNVTMNTLNTINESGFTLETQSSLNIKESKDIISSSVIMDLTLGQTYDFNLLYNKKSVYKETKVLELPVRPSMGDILLLEPNLSIRKDKSTNRDILISNIKVSIKYLENVSAIKLLLIDTNNNKTIVTENSDVLKNKNITIQTSNIIESKVSNHEYRLFYRTTQGYYDNSTYLVINYFNPIQTENFKDNAFLYTVAYGKIKLQLSFLETLYFQIDIKKNSETIYVYTIYEKDTDAGIYHIYIDVPIEDLNAISLVVTQYNVSIHSVMLRTKTFTNIITGIYTLGNLPSITGLIRKDFRNVNFIDYISDTITIADTILLPKEYYYVNNLIIGPNVKMNLTVHDLILNRLNLKGVKFIYLSNVRFNLCTVDDTTKIKYNTQYERTIQYFNTKNDDNIEYSIILEGDNFIEPIIKNITFNKYVENITISNIEFNNCSFVSTTKNIRCSPSIDYLNCTYILTNGYFIGKGVKYTDLSHTIFRYFGTSEINKDVRNCDLTNCDFSNFDISGMNFTNSTLRYYIPGPLLKNPEIPPILPDGYKVVRSTINGIYSYYLLGPYVDLTNITINECDLTGVDLSNAIISNTQITTYFLPTDVNYLPNSSYTFVYSPTSKLHNMIGPYVNINGMYLDGFYHARTGLTMFFPNRPADEILFNKVSGTSRGNDYVLNTNYKLVKGIVVGPNINLASNKFDNTYITFDNSIDYSKMYFSGLTINTNIGPFCSGPIDGLLDLSNIDFSFGNFSDVTLFKNCNLTDSIFDNCKFDNTKFYNTTFDNCSFKNVSIKDAIFSNCTFNSVTFENIIWETTIQQFGLLQYEVQNCSFDKAVFTNSKCFTLHMKNNTLTNITFSNTIFTTYSFENNTLSSGYTSTGKGLKGKGVIDYLPTIIYPSLFFENNIENYLHRLLYYDITTYTSYTNEYIFFKNNIVNDYILNNAFYVNSIQANAYNGTTINYNDKNTLYNQISFIGNSSSTKDIKTIRNDTFSLFELNFLIFLTILTSISLVNDSSKSLSTSKKTDMISILNDIKTAISSFNFVFNSDNKYINEYTNITVTGPTDFNVSDEEYTAYKISSNSYDSTSISSDMSKIEDYNKIIKFNVKDLQLSKKNSIDKIVDCLTEIDKLDYDFETISNSFVTLIKELNKLNSALVKKYHIVFKLFAIQNPNIDINFSKKVDMYMNEYTYTAYDNTTLDTTYARLDINSVKTLTKFLSLYDTVNTDSVWKTYVCIHNFLSGSLRLSESVLYILTNVEEFMSKYNINASKKHIFIFNKFLYLYKPIISLLISTIKRVSFQNIQELIKQEVITNQYSNNFNINYSDMKTHLKNVLSGIEIEYNSINTDTIYSIELNDISNSTMSFIKELKTGNNISVTVDIGFINTYTKITKEEITPIYKVIAGIITCPNCNFSNIVNLYKYDFSGCDLTNAKFSNCVLANVQNGIVTKTNFKNSIIKGANFSGCKFSIPIVNDGVYKFDLDNFDLTGCDFSGCDLGGVSIKGSNMTNAIFPSAISVLHYDLSTNFTGMKTESSSYNYTYISQVCLGPVNTLLIGGYKVLFFDNKYFFIGPNTNIIGYDLRGQNLSDIDITNSNIYNVTYDFYTIPPKDHKFIQSNGVGCLIGPTVQDRYQIDIPNDRLITISSSSASVNYEPYKAFDNHTNGTDLTIGWRSRENNGYDNISGYGKLSSTTVNSDTYLEGSATYVGHWVQVDMNKPCVISSLKIFMYIGDVGNRSLHEQIILAGSNDNEIWDLVYDSFASLGKIITYKTDGNQRYNVENLIPTNSNKYSYFRYIITKLPTNNLGYAILSELELNAYADIVFANNDLSNAVLSKKDLRNKNFERCNLTNTSFDYSDLTNCNLTNTILCNTDLSKVVNMDLSAITLKGIKSGGILNYKGCKLPDGYLVRYGFILGPGVDLTNLSAFDVDKLLLFDTTTEEPDNQIIVQKTMTTLNNVNLNNIDLRDYDLDGCIAGPFLGTPSYLPETNWKIVKNSSNQQFLVGPKISFQSLVLNGCDFDYMDLTNVNFTNTTLTNVSFINSNLSGILPMINKNSSNIILPNEYKVITNSTGTIKIILGPNVNLSGINLNNFIFENMNLTGVNFSNATLTIPNEGSNIHNIFINCILNNVNFSGFNKSYITSVLDTIKGINFNNLDLNGCNFTNTYLRNSTFINSNLNNVRFINSNLDYTRFKEISDNKSTILNFDNTVFYNVSTDNAIL